MEGCNLQHSRKTGFWRRLGDRRGQSTTEYILILLVVVMVAKQFSGGFKSIMNSLTGRVQSDLTSFMDN